MEENRRFWTEFIGMYKENSCLWDVYSKDYMNKQKRHASYELLCQKLRENSPNATLEILKKKINNMRTAFRRELKKVKDSIKPTGTGTDKIYEPTLWYFDQLLFTVQPDTFERKRRSTDELDDDNAEATVYGSDSQDVTDIPPSPETPNNLVPQITMVCGDTNAVRPQASRFVHTSENKDKVKYTPIDEKKPRLSDLAPSALTIEDEYSIAGKRIGYQLKSLDTYQRTIAEKLISDIIFYGKMNKLTENASVHYAG